MKKTVVLLLSFIFLSTASKPLLKEVSGRWLIESITTNDNKKIVSDSVLLNDVSLACFYQSIWKFNPDTFSGEYNINDLYCSFGKRKFLYQPQELNQQNNDEEFSIVTTQKKGKRIVNKPTQFKLIKLSNTELQWQHSMLIENKITTIKINFKKLNNTGLTSL